MLEEMEPAAGRECLVDHAHPEHQRGVERRPGRGDVKRPNAVELVGDQHRFLAALEGAFRLLAATDRSPSPRESPSSTVWFLTARQ
jgi:hypothetical protein